MDYQDLLKKLKEKAKQDGVSFRIDKKRGKGSHATVYYGDRFAIVKLRGVIPSGTLSHVFKQLGVRLE
ncbi:hypothetical protein [Aquimonas sp.]|jgi:mRNA interferase HicA|uniref:hypothetical protein n=1 Tax=Aquimonas sp. TaxID=1872588 RepID=UPI0037C094F2